MKAKLCYFTSPAVNSSPTSEDNVERLVQGTVSFYLPAHICPLVLLPSSLSPSAAPPLQVLYLGSEAE